MNLYHYSAEQYNVLNPTIGGSQHRGEDNRAVDKPVIWLTDSPNTKITDSTIGFLKYQHVVEVSPEDSNLHIDKKKADIASTMHQKFGVTDSTWYFYTGDLPVIAVRVWNERAGQFEETRENDSAI